MKIQKLIKILAVLTLIVALPFVTAFAADTNTVKVATLKGPTGMAMANMMTNNSGTYEFTLASAPDELTGLIVNGSVDIAAVPTNLAAVLYNKTQGGVKALSLITRGMLYVLEKGESIQTADDLAGKTITLSGQGSTPEYVMQYILSSGGIEGATLDFKSEHSEVITLAASGEADVVVVPEPYVTSLLAKDAGFRVALDVTELFNSAAEKNGMEGAQLSMSTVIVNTAFYEAHPDQVATFLKDLGTSIAYATGEDTLEACAQEIETLGIIASAKVAASALPNCKLVFVTGEDMKTQLTPMLQVLFEANPASVGGTMPGEDFWAIAE